MARHIASAAVRYGAQGGPQLHDAQRAARAARAAAVRAARGVVGVGVDEDLQHVQVAPHAPVPLRQSPLALRRARARARARGGRRRLSLALGHGLRAPEEEEEGGAREETRRAVPCTIRSSLLLWASQ